MVMGMNVQDVCVCVCVYLQLRTYVMHMGIVTIEKSNRGDKERE